MAAPRTGDVRHSLADVTRAKERFGFAPTVGFAEGLARTFAWYRAQIGSE
jgi:UDP-glucose 4-epimerase